MSQVMGAFMVFLGLLFLVVSLWIRRRELAIRRVGVETGAVFVEDSERRSGSEGPTFYATPIEWKTISGDLFRTEGAFPTSFEKCDRLRVVYDPEKPKRFVADLKPGTANTGGGLFAFGRTKWVWILVFLIPGVVFAFTPIGDPIPCDEAFFALGLC